MRAEVGGVCVCELTRAAVCVRSACRQGKWLWILVMGFARASSLFFPSLSSLHLKQHNHAPTNPPLHPRTTLSATGVSALRGFQRQASQGTFVIQPGEQDQRRRKASSSQPRTPAGPPPPPHSNQQQHSHTATSLKRARSRRWGNGAAAQDHCQGWMRSGPCSTR